MKRKLSEIADELNHQSGFNHLPSLIFITDQKAQPCPETVIDQLPIGSMVIFRDYAHKNRNELGQALRYIAKARGIKFLVAGDISLTLMVAADGIHLPEHLISQAINIKTEHPDLYITVSCHTEEAILVAMKNGVDAVLLGPVFPTKSHPETFDEPTLTIGAEGLKKICEKFSFPIYALGGVNQKTAEKIVHCGATGIAAIRGFSG